MFTLFNMPRRGMDIEEIPREHHQDMTGHDRFCQLRPGAPQRRRRRGVANRRTQSAIEIECNNDAFATVRSVLLRKEKSASIEEDDVLTPMTPETPDEETRGYNQLTSKIDSLAKILFNRVYAVKGYKEPNEVARNNGRQQYMSLEQQQNRVASAVDGMYQQTYNIAASASSTTTTMTTTPASATATTTMNSGSSSSASNDNSSSSAECMEMERRSRDRALSICRIYTRETPRYSLLKHLNNVGSRVDKHWFVVRDNLLKTDRLLTLAPLNRNCSLNICPMTRDVLNKLFLTLQHPYICPIFDLEFVQYEGHDCVVLVQPINQGSLKDIIYGIERNCWNEDWSQKYSSRGKGLPITQIQRMGRQVLEALMFLKERDFPTVAHLHSGNVIVTNGVARLAALENTLLGFTSRIHPVIASRLQNNCKNQLAPEAIDTVCFGHMLFEMTAGYELCTFEPTAVNLSDIQRYPQVLDCLRFIFDGPIHGLKYPSVEQIILHDLFRNIDLREMRNASVNIFRPDTSIPISKILEGIKCQKANTPVKRLSKDDSEDMISLSSPESDDRSENGSLLAQIYKELSITSV